MLRRTALAHLMLLASPAAWSRAPEPGADAAPAPRIAIPRAQLEAALAQRFPLRYPIPGLLDLDLSDPQLQLLPAANRLGVTLALQASGPALQRSHAGSLGLECALRYEAADRTLRATQLRLTRLQFPTLPPAAHQLLASYGPVLAEQSLLEVVLHRLTPKDLALADGLGLQPGVIRVTEGGLSVELVPKS